MNIKVIVGIALFLSLFCNTIFAEKGDQFKNTPTLNKGKKWNVGIWVSGAWPTLPPRVRGFIEGLMDTGWIEKATLPELKDASDSDTYLNWLVKDAKSQYLHFDAENNLNANYDKVLKAKQTLALIERSKKGELDLVMIVGTDNAAELANKDFKINSLVVAVSDAIKSNIIKSVDDSGFDHINANVSPSRWLRQYQLFHQIIKFKKLGLIYEDTEIGKSFAALSDAQSLAASKGFTLVTCFTKDNDVDKKEAGENYLKCLNEITPKIDAIFVTSIFGVKNRLADIQATLNKAKIPSFSQLGTDQVKQGLLMSISQSTRKHEGVVAAKKMGQVFNGAKPRDLNQVVDEPQRIAINMKAASLIGYEPPADVLDFVDETFKEIEAPPAPKS